MNEERMLKPALIGGVLLGVLSSLPIIGSLNCVCCAWVIGGGAFAAYLYVKDSSVPVTLGRGVTLGLLTGLIGTVVSALFYIPLNLLMQRSGMGIVEQMRQSLERMPNMPAESRRALETLLSSEGAAFIIYASLFIFTLIGYAIFAMIGGAIGVALCEKRKPGEPAGDAADYQPPTLPPPAPPAPPSPPAPPEA